MLKSMTAYGRAESLEGDEGFIVEIRSVNYRYREIIVHLSHSFKVLEGKIREMISSMAERGRIEVSVQRKNDTGKDFQLKLNRPLLKSYSNIFNELNRELGVEKPPDLAYFYQLKDIIIVNEETPEMEKLWPDLKVLIEKAMLSLNNMKKTEGSVIEQDFFNRLQVIARYINEIRVRSNKTVKEYTEKLMQSIKKLIEHIDINEDRLFQEVAFMAEKSDITEELVRMESHVEQFKYFMGQGNAVGRKLDFLLQELNREVNTIGSKASDSIISHYVVEVKAELEKLREQIQNIE
jgi:uncharacterized protein (TIGR00255 family)